MSNVTAVVSAMPGTSGFTVAVFKADEMPVGSVVGLAATSAASAAPADERAKFEEWAKREDGGNWELDDELFAFEGGKYKHVGVRNDWNAWQAAIAASSPKCELTDEQIATIYKTTFESQPGCVRAAPNAPPLVFAFGRAIAAASGPNAWLVEALKSLYYAVDSSVDLTPEVMRKARAALAAAGIKE